jgi:DNA-binding XRE family transcriptional regulator
MLEPTKKPLIELLHVACPQSVYDEVLKMLEGYDCRVERAIPAEELLDQTPGTMLRGARYREDMTQVQLAEVSGIPRRHISDMENNRRPIGKQAARKLAEVLKVDYRVFL